jgi:hypothetical protein
MLAARKWIPPQKREKLASSAAPFQVFEGRRREGAEAGDVLGEGGE